MKKKTLLSQPNKLETFFQVGSGNAYTQFSIELCYNHTHHL
jgi:hypothetical protein